MPRVRLWPNPFSLLEPWRLTEARLATIESFAACTRPGLFDGAVFRTSDTDGVAGGGVDDGGTDESDTDASGFMILPNRAASCLLT